MMLRFVWAPLLLTLYAPAKTFQNSYIRFNLPDSWSCVQEGAAWICAPLNSSDAREAVIVATAKVAGPEDNLSSFTNYLRQPKTLITKTKSSLSQPLSVNQKRFAGLDWIQAIHFSSEVPNFTTRYLATVKDKLAVLISFSADKDNSGKYDAIFDNAIRSIQVDASKPLLAQAQAPVGTDRQGAIGQQVEPQANLTASAQALHDKKKKIVVLTLVAASALIVLMIIRKLV